MLLFAVAEFVVPAAMAGPLPAVIVINLISQATAIAGWHAAVAICTLLAESEALPQVFE